MRPSAAEIPETKAEDQVWWKTIIFWNTASYKKCKEYIYGLTNYTVHQQMYKLSRMIPTERTKCGVGLGSEPPKTSSHLVKHLTGKHRHFLVSPHNICINQKVSQWFPAASSSQYHESYFWFGRCVCPSCQLPLLQNGYQAAKKRSLVCLFYSVMSTAVSDFTASTYMHSQNILDVLVFTEAFFWHTYRKVTGRTEY